MSVTAERTESSKAVTIQVEGRFDFSCHQEFIKAYKEVPKGEYNFIVDLSKTDYMDSSALGMLLQLREHGEKASGTTLSGPKEEVRKILRIANFDKLFTIT